MPDTLQFLFWFVGMPAGFGVCVLVMLGVEWAVGQVETFAAHYKNRLGYWRSRSAERNMQQQDQKAFLDWLAAKTGGEIGGAVDERLVEAQKQSELIRVLVEEEVPKAVMKCVETHRLMANITGAHNLIEIAYEPECLGLRSNVVWLLSHTVQFLEAYPLRLEDKRLLHNSIALRKRALPVCRRCPFIELTTEQAVRLCPTAELVQLRGAAK